MTLQQLAEKYGTDKLNHGYIPFYEKYLPKNPKRILEIGVKEGRSIAMWAEYFPDAEIHGLDLFIEFEEIQVNEYLCSQVEKLPLDRAVHIQLHKGNQCDWLMLEELRKYDFDIIIDDGSHNARDQMMTFFGLFNGKHYFIEDLHCNNDEYYSQGLPYDFRANDVFCSIYANNDEHGYDKMIIKFDDISIYENKIVCIYAAELNATNKKV
jgi:hypothetical protein